VTVDTNESIINMFMVYCYGISVLQMITDMFCLSFSQSNLFLVPGLLLNVTNLWILNLSSSTDPLIEQGLLSPLEHLVPYLVFYVESVLFDL